MLRTVQSLPLAGLSTLGFDPTRFQTEPPVCYRTSWQLPGPDFHRQATTSTNTTITPSPHEVTPCSALLCWAHERSGLGLTHLVLAGRPAVPQPAVSTASLSSVGSDAAGTRARI